MENLGNFSVRIAACIFEEQIRFGNELHVGVFNAVVDHFYVMSCPIGANVRTARFSVAGLSGNGFVNRLDFGVRSCIATRHNGWAAAGTGFAAGNAHAVKMEAMVFAIVIAAARIAKV